MRVSWVSPLQFQVWVSPFQMQVSVSPLWMQVWMIPVQRRAHCGWCCRTMISQRSRTVDPLGTRRMSRLKRNNKMQLESLSKHAGLSPGQVGGPPFHSDSVLSVTTITKQSSLKSGGSSTTSVLTGKVMV